MCFALHAQLVAVRADEWQQKTMKVLSQANPKLDVVRELVLEGRELGFQDTGAQKKPEQKPWERKRDPMRCLLFFIGGVFCAMLHCVRRDAFAFMDGWYFVHVAFCEL